MRISERSATIYSQNPGWHSMVGKTATEESFTVAGITSYGPLLNPQPGELFALCLDGNPLKLVINQIECRVRRFDGKVMHFEITHIGERLTYRPKRLRTS